MSGGDGVCNTTDAVLRSSHCPGRLRISLECEFAQDKHNKKPIECMGVAE